MQIVTVQLDIAWHNRSANHERVRRMLSNIEVHQPALIILPEMFDTGFSMDVGAAAQTEVRESEAFLRELAASTGAAVLAGVVAPAADGVAANEAVAFAPDGSELVRYRKMQPFTAAGEHEKYQPGDGYRIFEWAGVKIAPFICYDLRFPEIFRPAVLAGAEFIPVIASWPQARSEHWVRLLQARAIENLAVTAGVNRCGSDPSFDYDGRTAAFDQQGVALFEADAAAQVCTATLNIDAVRAWRAQFPALRDVRNN